MPRRGVFEKVWNLESIPTTPPGSMHSSSAVVSCLYLWRWVRSLLLCLHLSAVCLITHVRYDAEDLHELTVPFPSNLPFPTFSLFTLGLLVLSGFSFATCSSLQVLFSPDPGMSDHLAGVFFLTLCRYLGFYFPSQNSPLSQAREIPACLALAYNSYLPNQDLP